MLIAGQIKEKLADKIFDWHKHTERRIYFSVKPQDLKAVAGVLFKELHLRLCTCTGQDTPKGFEILYHFSFDKTGEIFSLRVLIEDKKNPEIDSLAILFPAAEWIEREIWEMLGINFIGHPNLKRLLLAENWPQEQFPLRHE